jgi:glycosyltransferase involved in cell wall biosynthesis
MDLSSLHGPDTVLDQWAETLFGKDSLAGRRAEGLVVLQVLPELETGGVERGTIDLANFIASEGGTAIVASAGGRMEQKLDRSGTIHITLPLNTKNPLKVRRNVGRLKKIIRDYGVDVVHARSRAPAWSAELACRKSGAFFVTTFHGTYNFKSKLKRWYNSVMTRGQRVIAVSHFISEHMQQNYGTPLEKVHVIHRGVDVSEFRDEAITPIRIARMVSGWRIPEDRHIVVLPGRLSEWKGQKLFIEAINRLKHLPLCCLMVGSHQGRQEYYEELRALIKKYELEDTVSIVGNCDDMATLYKLADVVVSGSIEPEAFGRIVAEAQAMGTLPVAPDHGGATEQIISGENGYLYSVGNAEEMADAIEKILVSNIGVTRMREQAISSVRENFTKERMCQRTLAAYWELIESETPYGTDSYKTV